MKDGYKYPVFPTLDSNGLIGPPAASNPPAGRANTATRRWTGRPCGDS